MNWKNKNTFESRLILSADGDDGNDTDGSGGGGGSATNSETSDATSTSVDNETLGIEVLNKDGSEVLKQNEIKALLSLDPVEAIRRRKEKQKEDEKQAKPNTFRKKEEPVKTPPNQKGTNPPEVKPKPETPPLDPNVQALAQSVEKIVKHQQTPTTKPNNESVDKSFYGGHTEAIEIDPRAMEALDSADPDVRSQAMSAIVNGVANVVIQDALNYVHQAVIPNLIKQAQQQAQFVYQQMQWENLLSAAHPIYQDQALRPIVQQIGAELVAAKKAAGQSVKFDKSFIDELTPAVLTYIQARTNGNNASQQQQTVIQQPSKREPIYSPTVRSRPPAESDAFIKSADLLDSIGIAPRKVN